MTPQELEAIDRDLVDGKIGWTRDLALDYAFNCPEHPAWNEVLKAQKISMLGIQTLMMCRAYGLSAKSGILEIGSYVGGSTVALGMGLALAGRKPMVTVDIGGAYTQHPTMPSNDIHADWRKNVEAAGFGGMSTLVGGWFNDEKTIATVREAAAGAKFDVMFLDANGEIKKALQLYADMLTDDCLLILDDYYNVFGPQEKAEVAAREIHRLMEERVIEQYVLTPLSTWVGRLKRRDQLLAPPRSRLSRWFSRTR